MNRKTIAALLFIIVTSCASCAVKAQNVNTAKLDSFFNALSSHDRSMGSAAITHNGLIVYQKAIGYSQINGDVKTPATIKTKYRIGSISKMFTGTMIFQLIEEGKLGLATTLATYYPQVPNAAKITIGEMLSHRSGLHNFTSDSLYLTYNTRPQTEADMLGIIQKEQSDFEPDSKASYSNTNFVLLGYIIEKITGTPYGQALKKRITTKIGLEDTYYGGKTNTTMNEAYSYTFDGKWEQQPETDMSVPGGAGAILSTPADLCNFISALFAGKLISEASLEQMKTAKEGYGMAMFPIPFNDKKTYGHSGGVDGFTSMLLYSPDDKMAAAYTTNGTRFSANDVIIGMLSIYFNKPYTIPDFNELTLNPEDLDKYLGIYSSTQMPLKITVTKKGNILMAQATGQGAFALEATLDKDKFAFKVAGVVIQFDPVNKQFTLLQGGQSYLFTLIKPQ
jgi:D-alanyl-D-alanine carboxypeptidase